MRAALRVTWLAAIAVTNVVLVLAAKTASDPLPAAGIAPYTASATSGPIQMRRIELIPVPAKQILSAPRGFDLDHDSHREFVILVESGDLHTEFYECTADDTFVLAHVIVPDAGESYRRPMDAGDIDADGLSDLVMGVGVPIGGGNAEQSTRVYESVSVDTYPTELAWEVSHGISASQGGLIADTDGDGKQEIIIKDPNCPTPGCASEDALVIYENDGDDSYVETYSGLIPGVNPVLYSLEVGNDLDGDLRREILISGWLNASQVIAFENTGDDSYELAWSEEIVPAVNAQFVVDGGDLDGDGRKEFLAGGEKPIGQCHLHVFEAVADNEFEIVTSIIRSNTVEGYCDAAVADVDGDGRREIVFSTTWSVTIFENTGDDTWSEIWSANWANDGVGPVEQLGAGDHDGDGKDEIIFRQNGWFADTGVWEIHPAYQADMDADDVVDVIDNCPLTPNSTQDDADADTVGDVCDNCIYGPNPAQGPAIFGQELLSLGTDQFGWAEAADAVYVRGDLAQVASYTIEFTQSLVLAQGFTDASLPVSGAGFWYLVKPDCAVGSWQSSLGAEPGRDPALP